MVMCPDCRKAIYLKDHNCRTGSVGGKLILKERIRQIEKEGWTPVHDKQHDKWELLRAARCYALPGVKKQTPVRPDWPWHEKWWKPSDDPVRNYVKAGALIAAAIDRKQT